MAYQGWFKGRYLRSSYEYIYALYLESLKADWDSETQIYQLRDRKYKPDFFIKTINGLKLVEVKSSKPLEMQKAKDCALQMKEIFNFEVEIVGIQEIKKICDLLNIDFYKTVQEWKIISQETNTYKGERNPHFGLKHTDKTKDVLSQKGKSRWNSYSDEVKYKLMSGLRKGRDLQISTTGIPKKPRVNKKCIVCGKPFTVIDSKKGKEKLYCSLQCSCSINSKAGIQRQLENKDQRNKNIREIALLWVENNSDIVMQCPKNEISTRLIEMLKLIPSESVPEERLRMVCYAFGLISRKELLKYFQEYLIKKYAELKQIEA